MQNKHKVFTSEALLLIDESGKVIRKWTNTQPLYLYPLSILDYAENIAVNGEPIKYKLLGNSTEINKKIISQIRSKPKNTNLEFNTTDLENIELSVKQGFRVSLTCTLDQLIDKDESIFKKLDSLRINLNSTNEDINLISKLISNNTLLGVRVYLNETDSGNYYVLCESLKNLSVDYVQVSKKLIPIGVKNVQTTHQLKKNMRNLIELSDKNFHVSLPKDTSKLYYDRFCISPEFNNSRACLVSTQQLVVFRGLIFPCDTKCILTNPQYCVGNHTDLTTTIYRSKAKDYREFIYNTCSDCAYIFENDILEDLKNAVFTNLQHKLSFKLVRDE